MDMDTLDLLPSITLTEYVTVRIEIKKNEKEDISTHFLLLDVAAQYNQRCHLLL